MSRPLHQRRNPDCDCGACCDGCGHKESCTCMRTRRCTGGNIAEEVAQEDGFIHSTTKRIYPPQIA